MGSRFTASACDGLLDCGRDVRGNHVSVVIDAMLYR
jgi:hypothetical protein